jgi:hypothetical protein
MNTMRMATLMITMTDSARPIVRLPRKLIAVKASTTPTAHTLDVRGMNVDAYAAKPVAYSAMVMM